MRVLVSLVLCGVIVGSSASAQSRVVVEGSAGLSFPTETDFKDTFETGLALTVRGSYAITDAVKATVSAQFNRFSSKDVFVDSYAAKAAGANGVDGINAKLTYNLFGVRAGVQYGGDVTEMIGFYAGVEAGPTSQKLKSDSAESDPEWDATVGIYAGGRYHFTPDASVGFGPAFSVILADESYHFFDLAVSVVFGI